MILEEVSNLVLRNREDVASNGAFHDRNLPFFRADLSFRRGPSVNEGETYLLPNRVESKNVPMYFVSQPRLEEFFLL